MSFVLLVATSRRDFKGVAFSFSLHYRVPSALKGVTMKPTRLREFMGQMEPGSVAVFASAPRFAETETATTSIARIQTSIF